MNETPKPRYPHLCGSADWWWRTVKCSDGTTIGDWLCVLCHPSNTTPDEPQRVIDAKLPKRARVRGYPRTVLSPGIWIASGEEDWTLFCCSDRNLPLFERAKQALKEG